MQQQFKDVDNFEERIRAMSYTEVDKKNEFVVRNNVLTQDQLRKYKQLQKGQSEAFEAINFEPNNNQYAVAAAAAANINRKRIMLQVGPGLGKSRIWTMLVSLLRDNFKQFRVYFTDENLQEREDKALRSLESMGITVIASNLEEMKKTNTTVIDGTD